MKSDYPGKAVIEIFRDLSYWFERRNKRFADGISKGDNKVLLEKLINEQIDNTKGIEWIDGMERHPPTLE